jgi:hypothetical protein
MKQALMAAMCTLLCVSFSSRKAMAVEGKGVIYGDRVNVRSSPDLQARVLAVAGTGQMVTVLEKTGKRMVIDAGDYFGYFWYRIDAVQGKSGWVYGKYLYLLESRPGEFVEKGSAWILDRRFTIRGREYRFGIAKEPAYPPLDENGITGTQVNAMPMLIADNQVYPFSMRLLKSMILYRQEFEPWLRLRSDNGVGESVASVVFTMKGKVPSLDITVNFIKQTGHGKYRLSVVPDGSGFAVSSYTLLEDVESR